MAQGQVLPRQLVVGVELAVIQQGHHRCWSLIDSVTETRAVAGRVEVVGWAYQAPTLLEMLSATEQRLACQ